MFIFIHIPKTAGTTFSSILRRNFKDKYIRPYGIKKIGFFSDVEVKALATFFPTAKCISAHKFICPIPQPDKESNSDGIYKLIVFLRDPVERTLSQYLFQKRRVKLGIVQKEFIELPFEQYFEKLKERGYQDSGGKWSYQCNMQAYVLDRNYNMEAAKTRMREELFFIGTSERFDESLIILRKKMREQRIDFKINYFTRNVSKKRKPAKDILEPAVYQKILEHNKLDKEVWDYANWLLNKEIEKYGPSFSRDLKKFRARQKQLSLIAPLADILGKLVRYKIKKLNDWFAWL